MEDRKQAKSAFDLTLSEVVAPRPMSKEEREAKRRRERLQQRVEESKSGVIVYLILSRYAIIKAANTEPNPEVRNGKRQTLEKMWNEFRNRLLSIVRS